MSLSQKIKALKITGSNCLMMIVQGGLKLLLEIAKTRMLQQVSIQPIVNKKCKTYSIRTFKRSKTANGFLNKQKLRNRMKMKIKMKMMLKMILL